MTSKVSIQQSLKTGRDVAGSIVLANIRTRRAVRKFKPVSIPRALVNKVIQAGKMAPSALNNQPWKFYVLEDRVQITDISTQVRKVMTGSILREGLAKALKAAISALHFKGAANFLREEDPVFHGAPVVIFITAPDNDEWALIDAGMCMQNMMLAAHAIGLATCPVGFAKYIEYTEAVKLLDLKRHEKVVLAVVMGYADEKPLPHERKTNDIKFIKP